MRISDIQNQSWEFVGGGFRNCGFISGYARYNKNEPMKLYIQQTQNEGQMIPVVMNDIEMGRNFREGSPVKARCRIVGAFDRKNSRQDVRLVAKHLEVPGISEMPCQEIWLNENNLPKGMASSEFVPSVFGDNTKVLTMDSYSNNNIVELAGVVGGFHVDPRRILEDGRIIPKMLFVFLMQQESIMSAIPIRYKGKSADIVKSKLKIGHMVFVKAQAKVKIAPVIGALPDENGMIPTIPFLYMDGNAFKQIDPKVATPGRDVPRLDMMPKWVIDVIKGGKDVMRAKLLEEAERMELDVHSEARNGPSIDSNEELREVISRAEF